MSTVSQAATSKEAASKSKPFVSQTISNQVQTNLSYKDPKALQSWEEIEAAIQAIYEKKTHTLSYQELYHHAYLLTFYGHGETAYMKLKGVLEKLALKMLSSIGPFDSEEQILTKLVNSWTEYKQIITILKAVFLYLDNNFVHTKNLPPILVLGHEVFANILLASKSDVYLRALEIILQMINNQRAEFTLEERNIQKILQMILSLGMKANVHKSNPYSRQVQYEYIAQYEIYEKNFEKQFLESADKFFAEESQRLILEMTPKEYVISTDQRYQEEKKRALSLLCQSTLPKLDKIFYKRYCQDQAKALLENSEKGLFSWADLDDYDVISKAYGLFLNKPESTQAFLQVFNKYIVTRSSQLATRQDLPSNVYIEDLFLFRKKALTLVAKSFSNHGTSADLTEIERQVQASLESGMNQSGLIVEQLNLYIDEGCQRSFQSKGESEMEEIIQEILALFVLVRDKDIFSNSYQKKLSHRLLSDRSLDETTEKLLVSKFKFECGAVYSKKLETMILDFALSAGYYNEFKAQNIKQLNSKGPFKTLDFDIKVLTCGSWPFKQQPVQAKMSPLLEPYLMEFEKYYSGKFKGRRIKWMSFLGRSIIKANYTIKKELVVSNIQMAILLLFNTKDSYSVQEISQALQIPFEDFKNHLLPLGQMKILKCEEGSSEFTFNDNFTSKNFRVSVNVIKKESSKAENNQTIEQVCLERKYVVESLIVKIMKSRRKMGISELSVEVVKIAQSQMFIPDQAMIKQCIESLIQRDYLRMQGDKSSIITYVI